MAETPVPPPYEWIRWLSGRDATALLIHLCTSLDDPQATREDLVTMVHGWRDNALAALHADNWRAAVDDYLEVTADARLYLLSQGQREGRSRC
jgi:hypothetical protein